MGNNVGEVQRCDETKIRWLRAIIFLTVPSSYGVQMTQNTIICRRKIMELSTTPSVL